MQHHKRTRAHWHTQESRVGFNNGPFLVTLPGIQDLEVGFSVKAYTHFQLTPSGTGFVVPAGLVGLPSQPTKNTLLLICRGGPLLREKAGDPCMVSLWVPSF